jgi:signal transduction histidine kinase
MRISPPDYSRGPNIHQLVAYIADLELEVDRLRKQDRYLRYVCAREFEGVRHALQDPALPEGTSATLQKAMCELSAVIDDLDESPASHPAADKVAAVAVRPLIEQVFRWQQRLSNTPHAILHLELTAESVDWFPIRLRHILENLISNALRYHDPSKGESRVAVILDHHAESLELRIADNGVGLPTEGLLTAADYLNRSASQRSSGTGVGLAVVKLLIEQSGGSLFVESGQSKGTQFVATLPRFDLGDYLT